ncbi:hypothetical protein PRIPAC_95329 [Pristionchus pacificus]|uniref:G protein-coupled receptor n=1 Tax=Pristionchus pacificus TaxID=54126 RepID=A0A2A6BXU5_PRIPA|nr:hypothetical protein PRIPAC_95329 [Pristionchus pacificus]|eukprot:PDM70676.1 G protein-coupled receptor [Pristionchus pacificus]
MSMSSQTEFPTEEGMVLRPQIYFFFIPLTAITLLFYSKILYVLWRRRNDYNSIFYKLIQTQALFDITYVLLFMVYDVPQDWPALYPFLIGMNPTIWPQLFYGHVYACCIGQILGVTLNSVSRMLLVCYPGWRAAKTFDELSYPLVMLIHYPFPFAVGFYIFFGQIPSTFEYIPGIGKVTRVTDVGAVQINSDITAAAAVGGAIISSYCYMRVFLVLRTRPFRSWRKEASMYITSFIMFLSLIAMTVYYFFNWFYSFTNVLDAMYAWRTNYHFFSFTMSLLNPWCLILTSLKMRVAVFGKIVSKLRIFTLSTNAEATIEVKRSRKETTTVNPSVI